jgi:4-hydroxy-3-polyprenylbenzoate decarboxylase
MIFSFFASALNSTTEASTASKFPTPDPRFVKSTHDLRAFIQLLKDAGELIEIDAPVSCHLEIAEITDRVSKSQGAANKALLFTQVEGYDMPLLINALGSHERVLMALGGSSYEALQARIAKYAKPDFATLSSSSLWDKVALLPEYAELRHVFPRHYKGKVAPCQEVVVTDPSQAMLDQLPILTCWPEDGGPFITLPCVFTKDSMTGDRNVGMYRLQKYDNSTTGMHWHKHHDGNDIYENSKKSGKPCLEVAVVLGAHPAVIYSATAPLPKGLNELLLAGFLMNHPVETVRCKTVNLDVPAHAEIVLEGYVNYDETRWEGPFGDHTGYYSLADDFPVFHVTAMTHRRDPIYMTTIVGKPPQEDCYLGKATEQLFLPLLKIFIPEIVDMNLPWEGVFHNCVLLSIKKRYPGHARKVMSAMWGFGQLMFSKYVVIVDEHVNVQNMSQVAWHVFNNTDPKRDMMFAEGPMDILDHATPRWAYGSKVGIDATKKWESEGFTREWPNEIAMCPAMKARVDERWSSFFGAQ